MNQSAHLFDVFMDVHRGLPRQGPGCADSTLQALSLCTGLPERPAVLDVGCGPGAQTLTLAGALGGRITAVDVYREYLDQLQESAAAAGIDERIAPVVADMHSLPFPRDSFDLIWAEGAAYIMGFDNALTVWKRFLKPGGYLAVSELVWLEEEPPPVAVAFFAYEYPPMTDVATNLMILRSRGYEVAGHFTVPASAWWQDYYTPLEAKLPDLFDRYENDTDALSVIHMVRHEIEIRQRFGASFGYEFFVARKPA